MSAAGDAARDLDQGVRQFLDRYAITAEDSWALMHAIRGFGRGCRLRGEPAAAYVLRTCVRTQEVHQRRYLYIPACLEVHANMFLKTFLEAGGPLSEPFACDGRVWHLRDLGEEAKALVRFDPRTFDRNAPAWSLIAFAELHAQAWEADSPPAARAPDTRAGGPGGVGETPGGVVPRLSPKLVAGSARRASQGHGRRGAPPGGGASRTGDEPSAREDPRHRKEVRGALREARGQL